MRLSISYIVIHLSYHITKVSEGLGKEQNTALR